MRAVEVRGPNDFRVVHTDEPLAEAGKAIVRVIRAGICASDLAIVRGKNALTTYPLTPGHECVGVIESVEGATELGVGDWVTVYPSIGCGACEACLDARTNHCPQLQVLGITRSGGCFAEKFSVDVDQLLALPPTLHSPASALVEPTAVAAHVVKRGRGTKGDRIVVIGFGVIGSLVAQVARARGAAEVILVDRFEERGVLARSLGFSEFVMSDSNLAQLLVDRHGLVDTVYDTVCSDETLSAALDVLKPGGSLVLVASPKGDEALEVPFVSLYRRELSMVVSRNYVKGDFLDAIELISSGKIAIEPLITTQLPLEEFGLAVDLLTREPQSQVKVLLEP